eukprot:4462817-Prymnesium_polylepis.1
MAGKGRGGVKDVLVGGGDLISPGVPSALAGGSRQGELCIPTHRRSGGKLPPAEGAVEAVKRGEELGGSVKAGDATTLHAPR